jgi:hypothetical protein
MTRDIGLDSAQSEPRGMLSIRTLAMPADTNQYGDIFGGWLLGQMDIAGGIFAANIAKSRTATVAVNAMTFRKPVWSARRGLPPIACGDREKALPHARRRRGLRRAQGVRNGSYKHGLYTAEAIASRRSLRQQIREVTAQTRRLRELSALNMRRAAVRALELRH